MKNNVPRLYILIGVALFALLLACGNSGEPVAPEDDLGVIWEAWQKIGESFAIDEALDPEPLVGGSLRGMLTLVNGGAYPFLADVGRIRGQTPPEVPAQLADVWRGIVLYQQRWPEIERSEMIKAIIAGMVSGLGDPTAGFLDAEAYPQFREDLEESLEGEYKGIGARVLMRDGQVVMAPFPDTPAEKAGVEAGDVLLEIEDESVAGLDIQEVVDRVSGPEGTKVKLLIERLGEPTPLVLQVFRGNISLPSVSRQLVQGGIGYIRVATFRDNTGEQVFESLEELDRFDMLALILDLRSNAGGSEEGARDAAGQFLPPGSLFLYTEDRQGKRQEQRISDDLERLELDDLPMVVLVNEGTIGEAEAVAAVLQESGRAVVIGTPTFGRGGTYSFVELDNGSAIYIPTLRWYTPGGKILAGQGVEPDITVVFQQESTGVGGESQFNRAYEYLDDLLPLFR